jgi:3-oxoacyl-[acyl-carrier protein] reductase
VAAVAGLSGDQACRGRNEETAGLQRIGLIGSARDTQMVVQNPLGRLGPPEDIARVALFLAADDTG